LADSEAAGKQRRVKSTFVVDVRTCHHLEEMRECVALQKEVWGFSDAELVPLRMFVVASKVGGQVIGGFDGNHLVAFLMAIPGVRNGHSYLHSHMLAVRSEFRDAGVGRSLKLFQRQEALDRDIQLIEWTFDPLEIKNSYLNIEKLGAVARRYNVNQYGVTSSPLQGGLPSDRLVAEWWLKSKRVQEVMENGVPPASDKTLAIPVPTEISEWKASEGTREKARLVQDENRARFQQAFDDGLSVLGYKRETNGNGTFLLGRWNDTQQY
jgi:predicted GNAT superfamily acetyltransferase